MKCIINKRIFEARKELSLSQGQLAKLCNVKQSCVSKWERGATLPDAQMICILSKVLSVSSDFLLGIKDY